MDKQKIILKHYHVGKSQRAIERETSISRKTIRKYIREYESSRVEMINQGGLRSKEQLIRNIVAVL